MKTSTPKSLKKSLKVGSKNSRPNSKKLPNRPSSLLLTSLALRLRAQPEAWLKSFDELSDMHNLTGVADALRYVTTEFNIDEYELSKIVGVVLDGWTYDEDHLAHCLPNDWELVPMNFKPLLEKKARRR